MKVMLEVEVDPRDGAYLTDLIDRDGSPLVWLIKEMKREMIASDFYYPEAHANSRADAMGVRRELHLVSCERVAPQRADDPLVEVGRAVERAEKELKGEGG